jgi:GNAT superfamily N-acetyltransferase
MRDTTTGFLSEMEVHSGTIMRAIERTLLMAQVAAGQRVPNRLADAVFYLRHPDLRGKRIGPGQPLLAAEWRSILKDLVEPVLGSARAGAAGAGRAAAGGGVGAPPSASDADVRAAMTIARRPVPGMPGTTIEQLIERWRAVIAPEIPMPVLLSFMRFESGGNFGDATHGSPKNNFTQPPFYELGLFQTPAGLHGPCGSGDYRSCGHPPPGREVPGDASTWARLCKRIGADPADWTNPVTQVRVGLMDLEGGAQLTRKEHAALFPTPGTDWDLRMAVLMPFARGRGFATAFLRAFARELAAVSESRRWDLLRGKRVRAPRGGFWEFDPSNVDKKMALAGKLGYQPR